MLSKEIKEATRSAHQALEKTVILRLKAIRSKEDYTAFLKCFYTYFSQVEKVVSPYITPEVLPDMDARRNSSFLKADIESLGGCAYDHPKVPALPEVSTPAQAMGALYVLEGSVAGGPVIVKMLEKNGITSGVSFFSGYGEKTPEMWSAFIETLDRALSSETDKALAVEAANQTFARFAAVFE